MRQNGWLLKVHTTAAADEEHAVRNPSTTAERASRITEYMPRLVSPTPNFWPSTSRSSKKSPNLVLFWAEIMFSNEIYYMC